MRYARLRFAFLVLLAAPAFAADVTLKHSFVSTLPDGDDPDVVKPSDWNASHVFSGGSSGDYVKRDTGSATGMSYQTGIPNADLDADLAALGNNSTAGLLCRTGAGAAAARTIQGGAGIAMSNGDGVSGDPSVATSSGEQSFLNDASASACGASTKGAAGVTDGGGPLWYCDDTATPVTRRAAYGDSSGNALAGDSATGFFASGQLGIAEMPTSVKTRLIVLNVGTDNGAILVDGDDQPTIFPNRLGSGITITEVFCESDAGTPAINFQRDDGSAADILSSDLSCSTSGATSTSFSGSEASISDTHKIDFKMVTAGGSARRLSIVLKVTLDS